MKRRKSAFVSTKTWTPVVKWRSDKIWIISSPPFVTVSLFISNNGQLNLTAYPWNFWLIADREKILEWDLESRSLLFVLKRLFVYIETPKTALWRAFNGNNWRKSKQTLCKQRDELNKLIVLLESVSIEFLHAKNFSNQKATLNKGVNLRGANEELRMKTIKRVTWGARGYAGD